MFPAGLKFRAVSAVKRIRCESRARRHSVSSHVNATGTTAHEYHTGPPAACRLANSGFYARPG